MGFKKILVPTDGSRSMDVAVDVAISLAKLSEGRITALYVLDQTVYSNMPMDTSVVNVYGSLEKEGKSTTEDIRSRCKVAEVPSDVQMIEGIPASVINKMSDDYDIIVMGTLGRTGMEKVLMGSVAEKVIEGSSCPVMVVHTS